MKITVKIVWVVSLLMLHGCKDNDSNPLNQFLNDATPRFEGAGNATIKNSDATHLFYADKGNLVASSKNKIGYAARDGLSFYFIEWSGDAGVGVKSDPTFRSQNGAVPLSSLEVVKNKDGVIWIVYQHSATSPEGRIVQKW